MVGEGPARGGHPLPISRRQVRALLYYLAEDCQPVSRQQLCDLLLPGHPESIVRRRLTRLLAHLRRALPARDMVQIPGDHIQLAHGRVQVDTVTLHNLAMEMAFNENIETSAQLIELYRGPFLNGFQLPANPKTDDLGCTATAPYDSHFHGTHTAGTICGRSFHGVNIGVAPDARLCSANVLPGGSGTFAQIINGMQCVIDQGVHVINMSLGALGYNPIWNLPILNATLSGVCIVASIGNSGHGTSGGPGNDPLAIGVGATGVGFPKLYHETIYDDVVAGFSSGETLVNVPWLNLFQLTYMKPEISAPGVQVLSAVPPNSRPDWPAVHSLAALNGTSMAAPHVTGTIAVLLSTEPALMGDPFTVKRILMGAGREDFSEAGRDQRFGFGRVDVLSASETAVSMIN